VKKVEQAVVKPIVSALAKEVNSVFPSFYFILITLFIRESLHMLFLPLQASVSVA